jgi:endonuclease/exonuclease/phosphatase family metal-dependent hydrolase
MAAIAADLWVLTETRASISPADGYYDLHSPPHLARRPDADERWVSIWSRWPLQPTSLPSDPRGAVSAIVGHPEGEMIVFGTVLPWANEKGDDGQAAMWQVHYEQIEQQAEHWRTLRELHPGVPLIVAGDFNQDRDGSGWYGTRHGRELLTQALHDADLVCGTEEDVVATGKLRESHLVDHIAICRQWADEYEVRLNCWEKADEDGTHLSDHPTVAIDLVPSTPAMSEQTSADPGGFPSP